MPPKARKRSAKAPAPLVDPFLADVQAACKEAKTATRKLNDMTEGDPGVEEQTAKAAAAQRTLIEAATEFATLLAIKEPEPPETTHEEEVAVMELKELVYQYRNAKDDHEESQCIKQMQETAKRLVEASTKDMGFQVGKPWLPSAKDDEAGQKQRIREPIESCDNNDEPPQDTFIPYRKPKNGKTRFADGTRISVDLRTGIAISKDNERASDDEEMIDVKEQVEAHGHGNREDGHGDGQQPAPSVHPQGDSSSSTAGGGAQEQQGEALNPSSDPVFELAALCTVCENYKPASSFRMTRNEKGECYECEAQEDARLGSKLCTDCHFRVEPGLLDDMYPMLCQACADSHRGAWFQTSLV